MPYPSTAAGAALPVPYGSLRIGGAYTLPNVLRYFGVEPEEVIASVGLDPKLFDDPDNAVEMAALGRLLCACVTCTGCQHFGLMVGQQGGPVSLGLIGLLAQHSPNLGRALRNIALYLHIHDRGAVITYDQRGEAFALGYEICAPGVACDEQIIDGAMAIGCNMMRAWCGADWAPTEVLLARRRPTDTRPYQAFFRCPVRFNAEQTALVFPSHWLQHPIAASNPELKAILKAQVAELSGRDRDFGADVRRTLRALLVTGVCTADHTASLFSMHRRTLGRRLEEQGASFAALLAEVRYEAASQLLDNTDMSPSDIALALGYSDVTAFNRAFRRWSGTTPGRLRTQEEPPTAPS
jgi:AraC-like DNA-binding protein